MGKASVVIREIRYKYDDSETGKCDGLGIMHIYILAQCFGDCPHTIDGWYHKSFPPGSTANDKDVSDSVMNYLTEFDRGTP